MAFQGSEHSGCEVTFYRQNADKAVRITGSSAQPVDGRGTFASTPSLISAQTSKQLGTAGTFTCTLKLPLGMSLFEMLVDDDWVDIVFTRGGKKWHTLRGSVDEIRCQRTVGGAGATSTTWTVTGRDFQKVFDLTRVWFDAYTGESAFGEVGRTVLGTTEGHYSSPAQAVKAMLRGFIGVASATVKGNWSLPQSLPNLNGKTFLDSFTLQSTSSGTPARDATNPNFLTPNGGVWDLATQWSDPAFCELYTDLLPESQPLAYGDSGIQNGLPIDATRMCAVFRDRPFLATDPAIAAGDPKCSVGANSAWFQLPMLSVPRTWIVAQDVGTAGYERYNAYYLTNTMTTEHLKGQMIDVSGAFWDRSNMPAHGLRRFDVVSNYTYSSVNGVQTQRRKVRDWYAPNPFWLNGTVSFGRGMPEMKVGTRLRIEGRSAQDQETYYIESVGHQWSLAAGMRSSANITRGFVGSDSALIKLVTTCAAPYRQQKVGTA